LTGGRLLYAKFQYSSITVRRILFNKLLIKTSKLFDFVRCTIPIMFRCRPTMNNFRCLSSVTEDVCIVLVLSNSRCKIHTIVEMQRPNAATSADDVLKCFITHCLARLRRHIRNVLGLRVEMCVGLGIPVEMEVSL